jgi:hypothetical protein
MPIKNYPIKARTTTKKIKLENILKLAKYWKRDSEIGSKWAQIIYSTLEQDGYKVMVYRDIDEGLNLPKERKVELSQAQIFKPDASIDEEGETIFIDAKGKSKITSLGWVNERDYRKYWNGITELGAKMRIYFYIEETREIYVHNLRDPDKEPHFIIEHQSDGKVFVVPRTELTLYKTLQNDKRR